MEMVGVALCGQVIPTRSTLLYVSTATASVLGVGLHTHRVGTRPTETAGGDTGSISSKDLHTFLFFRAESRQTHLFAKTTSRSSVSDLVGLY